MTNPPAPRFQFRLVTALEVLFAGGLWCAAFSGTPNLPRGIVLVTIAFAVTWGLAGLWTSRLSDRARRWMLACIAGLSAIAALVIWLRSSESDHAPAVLLILDFEVYEPLMSLLGKPAIPDWVFLPVSIGWPFCALLGLFALWDAMARRGWVRPLAWTFSTILVLFALPLFADVLGGCYQLRDANGSEGTNHTPWHCLVHLGMLAIAPVLVGLLLSCCWRKAQPPSGWLKRAVWGYLSGYLVLAHIALFPMHFYFPRM